MPLTKNHEKQNRYSCSSTESESDAAKVGNFDNLEKLLEEIQDWEVKNYEDKERFKFPETSKKERIKSVDVTFNEQGQLDIQNLQNEIDNCKDEYIKVRVPNNVDLSFFMIHTDQNNTSECRRRERAKTIAEYFV